MPYSPEQPQHRRPVPTTGGTEAAYRHARDNDPNVTFGVRMRLHSLELAKASTSEPYTFAIELSAHEGGSALRSRTFTGAPGEEVALHAEELSAALPNPPFAPKRAMEQLSKHPPQLTLLSAGTGGGAWRKLGVAEVPLDEVLRGSLRPLPAGPNTPPGQQAAATIPSSCSALITASDGTPLGTVHLEVAVQCVYEPPPAAAAPAAAGAVARAVPAAVGDELRFRLALSVLSVRDLAIPLGGYAHVYCRFSYPALSGAAGVRARVARTAAPVSLGRHSQVPLKGPSGTFDFACAPAALLTTLSHVPLVIELCHKDKYAADVLLGVATIDLGELLGVTPKSDARTPNINYYSPNTNPAAASPIVRQQEQSVFVVAPDGPPPPVMEEGAGAPPATSASSKRVALLRVKLALEEHGLAAAAAPVIAPASEGYPHLMPPAKKKPQKTRLGAPLGRPKPLWKEKEDEWRKTLKKKGDAALANLQREWRLREAKRDEAASRQRKAAAALEAELKSKLVDVRRHGKALIQAEEELSHRAEAEEERAAHERVVLRAQSERETAELQAELAAARATMRSAEAKANALAERARADEARAARHDQQQALWRDAQAEARERAMAAQAENGRLQAALEQAHADARREAADRRAQAASLRLELQGLKEQSNLQRSEEARLREALRARRAADDQQLLMRARTEDAHHEMRTARAELSAVKASLRDFEASSAAEAASAAAAAEAAAAERSAIEAVAAAAATAAAEERRFVETKALYGSPSSTLAHERRGAPRAESYLSMPPVPPVVPASLPPGSEGYPGSDAQRTTLSGAGASASASAAGASAAPYSPRAAQAGGWAEPPAAEVGRLREMCASFLSSGVYKEDDRVLVMLREESERLARAETRDAGTGPSPPVAPARWQTFGGTRFARDAVGGAN